MVMGGGQMVINGNGWETNGNGGKRCLNKWKITIFYFKLIRILNVTLSQSTQWTWYILKEIFCHFYHLLLLFQTGCATFTTFISLGLKWWKGLKIKPHKKLSCSCTNFSAVKTLRFTSLSLKLLLSLWSKQNNKQ